MNLLLAARDLGLVLTLLALCIAVGQWAVSRLVKSSLRPRESLLCSLGLGIGIVGTLIFFIGLLGFADGLGLTTLLAGLTAASWRRLRSVNSVLAAFREFTAGWTLLELGIISIIGLWILSHAALPVANYDSLLYHLAIPELYLREGRIFLPPNNFHAANVGIMHMLYLPLLVFGGSSAPALLNGVIALALIPLVHLVGERFWEGETGRLAAILVWAGPVLLLVSITPRVDVTLVWYLLLGHYLAIEALTDRSKIGFLWLSGLVLGIGIAVKLSAVLYVVAMSPLFLFAIWCGQEAARPIHRVLALLCVALAVPALPWFVRNLAWLGDPVYPFLAGEITPQWLKATYGGRVPSVEVGTPAILQIRKPFNLPDFFFAPHRLTPEGEGILYFANPVLLLLPLTLFTRNWTSKLWLALPPVLYVFGLFIMHGSKTNLRYMIPAVVPLSILAVAALTTLLRRPARWVATSLLLLPMAISLTLWSASQLSWSYLSGELSEDEYLSVISNQEIRTYVNNETAPDSKILLLFDGRVYGIERSRIPDPPGPSNWLKMTTAASTTCLEESGVTHVVVNEHLLNYQMSRGLDPESIRWDEFSSFEERCLSLLKDGGWYRVYRLEGGDPPDERRPQ